MRGGARELSTDTIAGARLEPTRARRRGLVIAAAAAVVAAAIFGSIAGDEPRARVAMQPFTNRSGGYIVDYPVGWSATAMGSTTKFTHPADDVVVGLGRVASAPLGSAARTFTDAVLRAYSAVRIDGSQRQKIGGKDAILISGSATNISRVRLRWLTVTIADRDRTYGISIFTRASSNPASVLPTVEAIVASFRPL